MGPGSLAVVVLLVLGGLFFYLKKRRSAEGDRTTVGTFVVDKYLVEWPRILKPEGQEWVGEARSAFTQLLPRLCEAYEFPLEKVYIEKILLKKAPFRSTLYKKGLVRGETKRYGTLVFIRIAMFDEQGHYLSATSGPLGWELRNAVRLLRYPELSPSQELFPVQPGDLKAEQALQDWSSK